MRDFSHLNEKSLLSPQVWLFIIVFFMFLGGGFAFFLFYFEIENIEVKKEESDVNLRHGEMLQMMEFVKKKNIFLTSSDFLEKNLRIRFPELDEVVVEKVLPSTLLIYAKTDPVAIKLIYKVENSNEQYYGFLSENGIFLENGRDDLFQLFEEDVRTEFIPALSKVFSREEISDIVKGKSLLEDITKRKIVSGNLLKKAQEIHFVDEFGVVYWLFLKNDITVQLEKLRRTLSEKNIYESPLEYVDLRITRKVIYLPK